MVTYPGLPGPIVSVSRGRRAGERYAPGTEFQIGRIGLVQRGYLVETALDRYEDGDDLARQPLRAAGRPAGARRAARPRRRRGDRARGVAGLDVRGRAVLVQTGWDRHWGTDAYLSGGHPFLTRAGAEGLRDGGAALVGIDGLNIDAMDRHGAAGAHRAARRRIPIVEHMTGLAAVPDGARFYAVPPPIEGMGTFPVRAFAVAG